MLAQKAVGIEPGLLALMAEIVLETGALPWKLSW